MISADYWVIGGACVFAVLGAALGFGRGLRMLSKGVLGKIAAVIFAYYIFGIILTLDVTKTGEFHSFFGEQRQLVLQFFNNYKNRNHFDGRGRIFIVDASHIARRQYPRGDFRRRRRSSERA